MRNNNYLKAFFIFAYAFAAMLSQGFLTTVSADNFQKGVEAYEEKDFVTAFESWLPLANEGNIYAQYNLFILHDNFYAKSDGLFDIFKAKKWLNSAAQNGLAQAQYTLGVRFSDKLDPIRWLVFASLQDHIPATEKIKELGVGKLHIAAQTSTSSEFLAVLTDAKDLNVRDKRGLTPLHYAANNLKTSKNITILLEAGAEPTLIDSEGNTPLHFAYSPNDDRERIDIFLQAGIDPNSKNNNGYTPLHYFSKYGSFQSVQALLEAGGDVNATTKWAETPLHMAVHNPNAYEVIQLLIKAGADKEAKDFSGLTPIFSAVTMGERSSIISLIDHGIDINSRSKEGFTPFHYATNNRSMEQKSLVKLLLQLGADVNSRSLEGETPLYSFARNGNSESIRLMIDAGANVNARDQHGYSPLYSAALHGNTTGLKVLIEAGAEIDAKSEFGTTPLVGAVRTGTQRGEIVLILLSHGAKINNRDYQGNTPLHVARVPEKIEVLLDNGADPSAKNEFGMLPWDFIKNNDEIKGTKAYWRLNDARFD